MLVVASSASAAGFISSLSVSPDSVRDGAASQGTVTLAFPDPAATTALLFSSDPSVASVPAQRGDPGRSHQRDVPDRHQRRGARHDRPDHRRDRERPADGEPVRQRRHPGRPVAAVGVGDADQRRRRRRRHRHGPLHGRHRRRGRAAGQQQPGPRPRAGRHRRQRRPVDRRVRRQHVAGDGDDDGDDHRVAGSRSPARPRSPSRRRAAARPTPCGSRRPPGRRAC